jgi:hypothetical protein
MKLHYWTVKYPHAICKTADYDLYIPANVDWVSHVADKPWSNPTLLAELKQILNKF